MVVERLAPQHAVDARHSGSHSFTYALYVWNGSFAESGVVREGYELNCPPLVAHGRAAAPRSLLGVDAPNIVIETVKTAEDGSSDIIVRMYESIRMATRCTLTTSLPVRGAAQTTMLEAPSRDLALREGVVELDFRPFEIKTVRLRI